MVSFCAANDGSTGSIGLYPSCNGRVLQHGSSIGQCRGKKLAVEGRGMTPHHEMTPSKIGKPGSSQPELILVGAGVIGGAVALGLVRTGRTFLWIAPFHDPDTTA